MLIQFQVFLFLLPLCYSNSICKRPFPKHSFPLPPNCSLSNCPSTWFGDKYCDECLNLASCDFDTPLTLNRTKPTRQLMEQSDCSSSCRGRGCDFSLLGNGVCDYSCNSWQCGFDAGDCGYCAQGCNL